LLHAANTHVENATDEILVEDVGTAGVVGTVPTSDGLGGLVMLPSGGGGPHAFTHDENAGDEILVEDLGTASLVAGQVPTADGAGGLVMAAVPAPTHAATTGQTVDDHHLRDHAADHAENATDEILVEDLGTASLVAGQVPIADGAGGLAMGAPSSSATREFWYPMLDLDKSFPYNQEIGSSYQWAIVRITNGKDGHFILRVPHDYTTLTSLVVVIIPDTTETVQFDADLAAAALGEDFETVTNSIVDATRAVTLRQMDELDLSSLFTGVAALDYAGIKFVSNTSNLEVIGLRLRYT
jgi:hypothetical protein